MKKYNYTFEFKKTEEEARAFCERINAGLTRYMQKTNQRILHRGEVKMEKKICLCVGIMYKSI